MQKINFQDLPSTATPLSAANLNLIQDNVEYEINGILNYLDTTNNYSTSENDTGMKWINDKPIYRIVKSIGYLANNGRTQVSLSDVLQKDIFVTHIYGITERKTGTSPNFTYDYNDLHEMCSLVLYRASSQLLIIDTNQDRSTYNATIIIEYIKTDD